MHQIFKPKRTEVVSTFRGYSDYPQRMHGEYFIGKNENTDTLVHIDEGHVNSAGRLVRVIHVRHTLEEYDQIFNPIKRSLHIEHENDQVYQFSIDVHICKLHVLGDKGFSWLPQTARAHLKIGKKNWNFLDVTPFKLLIEPGLLVFLGIHAREITTEIIKQKNYELCIEKEPVNPPEYTHSSLL
ncbi:hypothetical protein [Acanthopleuribacter pedis]|uniref:Uncharacterized protein n=1 Tax=Acanthopleuribacter pedis TaxID=442870 RepID=A0A8J7U762_9BACT|nr:hypothetical protein [Acanthopleuribacter pedis]MBO1323492.1 hypothetical protein [Acanthopleuribacter pedis]